MITVLLAAVTLPFLAVALPLLVRTIRFVRCERQFRERAYAVLDRVGPYIDDESRDLVRNDIQMSMSAESSARRFGVCVGCCTGVWGIAVLLFLRHVL